MRFLMRDGAPYFMRVVTFVDNADLLWDSGLVVSVNAQLVSQVDFLNAPLSPASPDRRKFAWVWATGTGVQETMIHVANASRWVANLSWNAAHAALYLSSAGPSEVTCHKPFPLC